MAQAQVRIPMAPEQLNAPADPSIDDPMADLGRALDNAKYAASQIEGRPVLKRALADAEEAFLRL